MASAKELAIATMRRLPDNATMEDIVEALAFRTHVDAGLRELDEGQGIAHEDVKRRLTGTHLRSDI
ncbi:MAG: hypothetical protein FJ290_04640 [Planctomycetes bacterium]|nr:hypothetical protein [Planctomycetota bacterium]